MNTYILTHEHEYGETVYMLQSKEDITESASEDCAPSDILNKVIQKLDIEFEPEKGEYLHINEASKEILNVDEL